MASLPTWLSQPRVAFWCGTVLLALAAASVEARAEEPAPQPATVEILQEWSSVEGLALRIRPAQRGQSQGLRLCEGGLELRDSRGSVSSPPLTELGFRAPAPQHAFELDLSLERPPPKQVDLAVRVRICREGEPAGTFEVKLGAIAPPLTLPLRVEPEWKKGGSHGPRLALLVAATPLQIDPARLVHVLGTEEAAPGTFGPGWLELRPRGAALVGNLELRCPVDRALELEGLRLEARSPQGWPVLVRTEEKLPVCPAPATEGPWLGMLEAAGLALTAGALGLVAGWLGAWFWSKNGGRPIDRQVLAGLTHEVGNRLAQRLEALRSQVASDLEETLRPVSAEIARLEGQLRAALPRLARQPKPPHGAAGRTPEQALLSVVHRFWQLGPDRDLGLSALIEESGLPLEPVRLTNLNELVNSYTGRSFRLVRSEGPAEWLLWTASPGGEAVLVPLDSTPLQSGYGLQVLRMLFAGLEKAPPSFRFREVRRACRLSAVPGEENRYRVVERGQLVLEEGGRNKAMAPAVGSPRKGLDPASEPVPISLAPADPPPARFDQVERLEEGLQRQIRELGGRIDELRLQMGRSAGQVDEALRSAPARLERTFTQLEALLRAQGAEVPAPPPARPADSAEEGVPPPPQPPVLADWGLHADAEDEQATRPGFAIPAPAPEAPAAGEEPGSFLQRVLAGIPGLRVELEAGAERTPQRYLEALLALEQAIGADAERAWQVRLVQFLDRPGDQLQLGWARPAPERPGVVESSSGTLNDSFLFQLGLEIGDPASSFRALAVAPGAMPGKVPPTYALLLRRELPGRSAWLARLLRPAVLKAVAGSQDLFQVVSPLEAEWGGEG